MQCSHTCIRKPDYTGYPAKSHPCRTNATVQIGNRWYCKRHAPAPTGPESYNLVGWESRIVESLAGMIQLYVEDVHHLPSASEYVEMAQQAIETTSIRSS